MDNKLKPLLSSPLDRGEKTKRIPRPVKGGVKGRVSLSKIDKIPTKILLALAFILLASIIFLLRLRQKPESVEAGWWNDTWRFRQPVTVGWTGTPLSDFQVSIYINTSALITANKMQSNCNDIRITDQFGNLLPHWIEENNPGCNDTATKIWLKLDTIPQNGTTVYLYYGNSAASNIEDGNKVFMFFDDFNTSELNTSAWNVECGDWSVVSGLLKIAANTNSRNRIFAGHTDWTNYIVETRLAFQDTNEEAGIFTRVDSNHSNFYEHWLKGRTTDDAGVRIWNNMPPSSCDIGDHAILSNSPLGYDVKGSTFYNMKAVVASTSLQTYIDKSLIASGTNSAFSSGKIGLWSWQTETNFDYVFVRQYSSSEPTFSLLGSEQKGLGPVAYWDFNEGTGTTAYDTVSNYHGSVVGATWAHKDQCIIGKCLNFNGTSNAVDVNNLSYPTSWSDPFSIAAWIYVPASAEWTNGYLGNIISRGSYTGSHGLVRSTTDNRVGMWIRADNGSIAVYGNIQRDSWHHLLGVWDGNQITFYINGVSAGQSGSARTGSPGATPLYIARSRAFSGAGGNWFTGYIDEPKIFDYALSEDQIKVEYNRGAGVAIGTNQKASDPGSTNLVAEWKFEEGVGTTAFDTSGNGYNAVFSSGSSAPSWTSGKIGKALSFDGADDMATASGLTWTPTTFTVSWWLYPKGLANFNQLLEGSNGWGTFTFHTTSTGGVYVGTDVTTRFTPTDLPDGTVETNKWQHFTYIYNGTQGSFYKNGQLLAGPTTQDLPTAWGGFKMGRNSSTATINGYLDHVKIFNTALTPDQIMHEYNQGKPLAHWSFNDGFGTTARDTSGYKNGTLVSGPTWQGKDNCVVDKCLLFDGVDDYVALGVGNDYFPLPLFSFCTWVKSPGLAPGMTVNGIFSLTYGLGFRLNSSGQFNTYMDNGTTSIHATVADNLYDNQFHHLCLTYDGVQRHMYIDGVNKLSTNTTWLGTTRWPTNSVSIGHDNNNPPIYKFNGLIDEPKLFNYALTPEEVAIEYNRGSALALGVSKSSIDAGTNNLIAEWKFEEGVGTTAYDTSGNNNHGLLQNSTTWISGKFGKGLQFSESNDRITILNSTSLNISNNITISAWLKPNDMSSQSLKVAISKGMSFELDKVSSSNKMALYIGDGSTWTDNIPMLTDMNINQWNYIVGTYDGSNLRIYLNGILNNTKSSSASFQSNSNNVSIGNYYSGGYLFDGQIDHVKIWNTALTPAQIAWEYNQGAPVGHWRLDECQGTTANDSSGNNNNGTIVIDPTGDQTSAGTCSSADSSHAWYNGSDGKINASIKLDGNGTADGVTAGDNIQIPESITRTDNYPGGVTYSIWINVDTNAVNRMSLLWGAGTIRHIEIYSDSKYFRTEAALQNGYSFGSGNFPDDVKGTWSHFVIVFANNEPGKPVRWYQNGKLFHTGSLSGGSYPDTEYFSFSSIGRSTGSVSYSYAPSFDGKIDDVRIYNYALTDDQVKNLYNGGSSVKFN